MNDKRTSPSTQSIFVIPIGDEVELYLEYNGLQWSNESINEEKLRSFSENCQGIQITFLDAENGKLLLFSQKEDMEDSIKIYFERISSEQLPCAFFDKVSKTYDNFEVSSQVAQMTVCFMEDGKIDVEWQYEEDEIPGPYVVDPVLPITQPSFPTQPEPTTPGNDNLEKLKQENIELKNKNEELSFEISNYKINEDSLSKKIAELQEENERLKAVSGGNAANDEEIDRLKTLVTQLVDNQFDDSYVQTRLIQENKAKNQQYEEAANKAVQKLKQSIQDACQFPVDIFYPHAIQRYIEAGEEAEKLLQNKLYTDVSKAVFYSKNEKVSGKAGQIVSALFGTEIPLSPSSQIEGFHDLLQNAYDKNVPYESVCGIYEHLQETLIDMQLSGEDVKLSNTELVNTIMEYGDVSKEKLEQLKETASDYEGCSFSVSNLVPSKVNIDTAGISIKTEIEKLSRIERRVIDGIDYYLIPVNSSSIDDILLANKHSK